MLVEKNVNIRMDSGIYMQTYMLLLLLELGELACPNLTTTCILVVLSKTIN